MRQTWIIAEAGVNHNGSVELAKQLIDVAVAAGADAVKFQTFQVDQLVTSDAAQANYQQKNMAEVMTQHQMLQALALPYEAFEQLAKYCEACDITFLSTPFDIESAHFLVEQLEMSIIKIPSGELTNTPFLFQLARLRKPLILSTGMATIAEIHDALCYIAAGLANHEEILEPKEFYKTEQAQQLLQQYVTLLHCTTDYPTRLFDVNLRAIHTLHSTFQLPIGFSDHTLSTVVPSAAVALGATIIEKHFTLDRSLAGPDHQASLTPRELREMVQHIRAIESALGTGEKLPTPTEKLNQKAARKSLVAKVEIQAGTLFSEVNLTMKRPSTGLAPSHYWRLIGQVAEKSYRQDELIDE